jgi:hypothetical protein
MGELDKEKKKRGEQPPVEPPFIPTGPNPFIDFIPGAEPPAWMAQPSEHDPFPGATPGALQGIVRGISPEQDGGGFLDTLAKPFTTPLPSLFNRPSRSILERIDTLFRPIVAAEEAALFGLPALLPDPGVFSFLDRLVPGRAERRTESRALSEASAQVLRDIGGRSPQETIDRLADINIRGSLGRQFGPGALLGGPAAAKLATRAVPAIARGARSVPRAVPRVAQSFKEGFIPPKIAPSVPSETIRKVTDKMHVIRADVVTRARVVQEKARAAVGGRAARQAELLEEGVSEAEAFPRSLAALRGRRVPEAGEPFKNIVGLTDNEWDELIRIVREFDDVPTEALNNQNALFQLFDPTRLGESAALGIQPAQLRRLERIFGTDFIDEVMRTHRLKPSLTQTVLGLMNLPKSFVSSPDISGALRQGRVLGNGNPRAYKDAITAQFRAMKSEERAQEIHEVILRDPRRYFGDLDLLKLSGVEITERVGKAVRLSSREEAYQSQFGQIFPWVRISERGFVTLLNKMRGDVLYKTADDWRAAGKKAADFATTDPVTGKVVATKEWKRVGGWINVASGRGPLPAPLKEAAPLLNAFFFSPRLNTSRIAAPFFLTQKGAAAMAAKDLMAFTTTNIAVLAMLDAAGIVSVNWKPTASADWLKARFNVVPGLPGPLRHDYWAGMQQWAVFSMRLMMKAAEATGKELPEDLQIDASTWELIDRMRRFKMSPTAGAIESALRGQDPLGEEFQPLKGALGLVTPLSAGAIVEGVVQRGAPEREVTLGGTASMLRGEISNKNFLKVLWDAARNGGILHGLLAAPEVVGSSVNSYETFSGFRDLISFETHGRPFNELKRMEEIEAVMSNPRLVAFQEKQERERGEPDFSPRENLGIGMRLFENKKLALEVELLEQLQLGVQGRPLRKAIEQFKEARFIAFDSVVSGDAKELLKKNRGEQAVRFFQDKYHSIDLEPVLTEQGELPGEGVWILDFDARDNHRREVLREAAAAGVSKESVTARSPDRFTDEQVRQAVEQFEADRETLRPYFDIPKDVIDDAELLRDYQTLPQRDYSRVLKRDVQRIRRDRIRLRRRSKIIDDLLLKYGYVTVSIRGRR